MQNLKPLEQFESYLVGNRKDRISRDKAQMPTLSKRSVNTTVGENDGPLLGLYLKSASAVWDYILS